MTTLATNLKGGASGQLFQHDYTGYCNFAGRCLAVSSEGLFEVCTGGSDDDSRINSYFTVGSEDFDTSNPKRIRMVYLQYESDGDVQVTLTPDEKASKSYYIDGPKVGQQRVRRKVARRPRGTHWELQFENINGSDIGVDSIELLVDILNQGFK